MQRSYCKEQAFCILGASNMLNFNQLLEGFLLGYLLSLLNGDERRPDSRTGPRMTRKQHLADQFAKIYFLVGPTPPPASTQPILISNRLSRRLLFWWFLSARSQFVSLGAGARFVARGSSPSIRCIRNFSLQPLLDLCVS